MSDSEYQFSNVCYANGVRSVSVTIEHMLHYITFVKLQ
jgi:hypothetical protein